MSSFGTLPTDAIEIIADYLGTDTLSQTNKKFRQYLGLRHVHLHIRRYTHAAINTPYFHLDTARDNPEFIFDLDGNKPTEIAIATLYNVLNCGDYSLASLLPELCRSNTRRLTLTCVLGCLPPAHTKLWKPPPTVGKIVEKQAAGKQLFTNLHQLHLKVIQPNNPVADQHLEIFNWLFKFWVVPTVWCLKSLQIQATNIAFPPEVVADYVSASSAPLLRSFGWQMFTQAPTTAPTRCLNSLKGQLESLVMTCKDPQLAAVLAELQALQSLQVSSYGEEATNIVQQGLSGCCGTLQRLSLNIVRLGDEKCKLNFPKLCVLEIHGKSAMSFPGETLPKLTRLHLNMWGKAATERAMQSFSFKELHSLEDVHLVFEDANTEEDVEACVKEVKQAPHLKQVMAKKLDPSDHLARQPQGLN